MPQRGFTLWFTGLSGAGKSTLALEVQRQLRDRGRLVEVLDGDEVRQNLSKGLGFSKEDRDTNIRRIGYVARLLSRNGVVAITATISPYQSVRDEVRALHGDDFVEVYVDCPIPALVKRDTKGLYEKALKGEVKNFTGISDPYEAPPNPELHIYSDSESVAESAGRIVSFLEAKGFIDRA
jgi:adenylyl-sulfate kinase